MTGSSTHTNGTTQVPKSGTETDADREDLVQDAVDYWTGIYDTPYYIELDSKAYFELVLLSAEIMDGRPPNYCVGATTVYSKLSNDAEAEVKSQQGRLTGVKNRPDFLVTGTDTKKTPNKPGPDWRNTPAYVLPGDYTLEAYDLYLQSNAESVEELTEIVSEFVETDELDLIEDLFQPKATPTTNAETSRSIHGDTEGREGPTDGTRGTPKEDTRLKGRNNEPPETEENRRSERSDLNSGADVSGVYKKGEGVDLDQFKTRGSRERRRFLDERVRMQSERLLFLDLIGAVRVGMYTSGEDDEWSVKPAEHLRKDMGAPRRTKSVWEGSELVECKGDGFYDADRGLCREMRIYDEVVEQWAELAGQGPKRWWLHTPEPERTSQPSELSTDLEDENGNRHPELIDKALRILDDAEHRIDLDAVDEAIDRLERKGGDEAREQLAHLRLKRETIQRQADGDEGVVDLQNAYTPDDSGGRITFKKGGPQGMLKAVKARAYDLEGVTNWDIKSCHTAALKQLADDLKELGVDIDTSPLDEYPGKDKVVEDTGLPRGLVKTVEHAVKNSAFLPASLDHAENAEREIPGTLSIADAARGADVDTDEALQTLHDVFANYRQVALEIARELLTTYWDEHKQPGGRGKPWCMKNHCGVPFYRDEHAEDDDPSSWCHNARTAVMAWALRGLEAAFCHSLTILSKEYDYEVAANEHDGLIVNGRLPDEDESDAIERAREMSGFHRAEIVEKPFADEEDIREVYGETDEEGQEEPEEASAEAKEPANNRPRRPGTRRRRTPDDEKTEAEKAAEEAQRDISSFHRNDDGTRDRRGLPTARTSG